MATEPWIIGFEEGGSPLCGYTLAGTYTEETSDTKDSDTALKCIGGNEELLISWGEDFSAFSLTFHFKILTMPGVGEWFGLMAGTESPTHDEVSWTALTAAGAVHDYSTGSWLTTALSIDTWYVYICHWTDNGDYYHEIRKLDGTSMGDVTISSVGGMNDYRWVVHDSTSVKGGSKSTAGGTVLIDNIVATRDRAVNLIDDATYGIGTEDYVVGMIQVNAAGDEMNWSGGGTYADVDELPADDATTDIQQSGGTGSIDALFSLEGVIDTFPRPVSSIAGVCVWDRRNAADLGGGGGMTAHVLIKTNSVEYVGDSSAHEGWTWINGGWFVNPQTSNEWTITEIDALQAGSRATAITSRRADISSFYVYVWYAPSLAGARGIIIMWFKKIVDELKRCLRLLNQLRQRRGSLVQI